ATIIPILLGSEGEPLDVGRATRTIPPGIRRAIAARDLGCIHPDCDAPAPRCEAHHVQHWTNGGPTALNNLVLLCPRHHWTIHHDQWRITFHEGIPHVIPPPLIDPEQRPRRNTMHNPPSG
ncbi:MAG TPA: HNH endonuclease signature motif containing protein, partial [Mycobacteriales bacterium]|nr:HNH endonuclease signature motif containing protein [Mycobacteriales bacterium]